MWKNTVQPDRPQMTIGRARIACWKTTATGTHSEYVILTDFHCNNGYTRAPQCYIIRTLPVLFVKHWSLLDVRGSVRHSTIHKEKSNKMQQCIKILLFHIYMKLKHVSGDTPPIIRSLKLHWQPLVFHMWKVV